MRPVWRWPLEVTVELAAFAVAREMMERKDRRVDDSPGDSFLTAAEDRVIDALVAYFGIVQFRQFARTVEEQQQQQALESKEVS